MDYTAVPYCVYTEPEMAWTGLNEQQAKDEGYDVKVGKFTFKSLGKALAINENVGLVKIVTDAKYGEILGVHIVGPHATDLIHEACVSIKLESTIDELMHTIHAPPDPIRSRHGSRPGCEGRKRPQVAIPSNSSKARSSRLWRGLFGVSFFRRPGIFSSRAAAANGLAGLPKGDKIYARFGQIDAGAGAGPGCRDWDGRSRHVRVRP